jgi:probable rRNA maturation factor
MSYEIDISNRQQTVPVDFEALRAAVQRGLKTEQVRSAVLSISLVDNATIHVLNRDHLQHDYPTDVISFQLDFRTEAEDEAEDEDDLAETEDDEADEHTVDADLASVPDDSDEHDENDEVGGPGSDGCLLRAAGASIEGEIIASVEMAAQMAGEANWSTQSELTLYVIHGMLHICGYDDLTDDERQVMRTREAAILNSLGLQ